MTAGISRIMLITFGFEVGTKSITIFINSLLKNMITTMIFCYCMWVFSWIDCWTILLIMSCWSWFLFKDSRILICSIIPRLKGLIECGNACVVLYISFLFSLFRYLCFVNCCHFCIVWGNLIISINRERLHVGCSSYYVTITIYSGKVRILEDILAFKIIT